MLDANAFEAAYARASGMSPGGTIRNRSALKEVITAYLSALAQAKTEAAGEPDHRGDGPMSEKTEVSAASPKGQVEADDAKDLLARECLFAAQEARKSNGRDTYSSRILDKAASYLSALSPAPAGGWQTRAEIIEECAQIAEKDCRTALAIDHDYKPTWYVHAQAIAADIRALAAAPSQVEG